ncbi:NADP-dependent 3-hydroxy acid dehydrogenase YdfG [Chitinophaga rupis]|uniref:NADP-dependent 3-hydroxy acid dehydrogenase YdfG n=1 Tax=Chitinophaga rupis TaxID=573321 RepID=A0A1H7ISE8_9BACT|nr:SDR family oxidoreductase [Chitinophaga rupis]SEK65413.1 NADP-dependent 3-hydroxy acid dehydrogenase YdfG [Chitinophaga rupis]
MANVWFITGSSRGLGRSLTAALLEKGELVAATARRPEQLDDLVAQYPDQIYPIKLDVSDEAAVNNAVKDAVARFGKIDVAVNNAGFGITGAAEAYTHEQISSQINTNLYGPIYVTRAVLPYMRKQRSGHILQISSLGGRIGTPGLSIYQATKFALVGFSEAVSKEIAPLGIKLTIIEPGGFRTNWAGDSMSFAKDIPDYEQTVGVRVKRFQDPTQQMTGDPDKAAQVMIDVVAHPEPPLHLILGSDAAGIIKQVEAGRQAEFEKWLPVSLSTDHEDAENFLESDLGRLIVGNK